MTDDKYRCAACLTPLDREDWDAEDCPHCGRDLIREAAVPMTDGGTDSTDMDREERLDLEDEGLVVEHPDHDDITRVAVGDWEHVVARVTSVPDHVDSDGMDISFDQFCGESSTVELIVKGETVLRLVDVSDGGGRDV